ncbi:MAG: polyprenyl synthetase family protein [Candidatus Omnitrophica bacterium]|nr:polyprenyl synthetase family protein [Candidatus Omnitrophota bacterium]
MKLDAYLKAQQKRVDRALDRHLPEPKTHPAVIHEAMRYAVLNGGKRFRPILAIACAEALGGRVRDALPIACALELIHSYSLVHDDLPSMDNDAFRRGKPAVHKKYGEAFAVLTGDALLTHAFHILAQGANAKILPYILSELTHAVGSKGMIGGQAMDKQISLAKQFDLAEISYVNIHKTGQLIRMSCVAGAISAGAGKKWEREIALYGECLGFSYQIVDDIMDGDGFAKIMSRHEAREEARLLIEKAKRSVKPLGARAGILTQLADFVLNRKE